MVRIPTTWKTYVAGVGSTLTALTSALAVVSVVVGNDAVDASEVGAITTAVAVLVGTVYGVWRTPYYRTDSADTANTSTQNRTY